MVRHPAREAIIDRACNRGITVGVHYPWPIHTMRAYADWAIREGALPLTENAVLEIFSLPMYPSLTDEDRVCDAVRDVVSRM